LGSSICIARVVCWASAVLSLARVEDASRFGSVTVGTLVLAGTGGTFTVGPLSATTLTTQSGAYGLSLTGGGTVTDAVTFANTGALSISNNVVFSGSQVAVRRADPVGRRPALAGPR
jgi:hypothetical protein